tara:strand:+ start:6535 stop:7191 length:657 start_codon:yes stop_codon:yes gene_type:complete
MLNKMRTFLNLKSIILVFLFFPFILSSQCVAGDCVNGFGKIIYEGNNSYEGYFKDGVKNGQGTLIEYTDEYKVTTKGLFVLDRIIEGKKVQIHLKLNFPVESTITSYSGFGDNHNKNDDKLKKGDPINADEIFDVVGETDDLSLCEISIFNSHTDSFILKLGSNSYSFKSTETKTITIKPGTYSIHASSVGVKPFIGEIKLEGGKKYSRVYSVITISN